MQNGRLAWDAVPGAIGYILEVDGKVVDLPKTASTAWKKAGKGKVLSIRAVNQYGSLGQKAAYYL